MIVVTQRQNRTVDPLLAGFVGGVLGAAVFYFVDRAFVRAAIRRSTRRASEIYTEAMASQPEDRISRLIRHASLAEDERDNVVRTLACLDRGHDGIACDCLSDPGVDDRDLQHRWHLAEVRRELHAAIRREEMARRILAAFETPNEELDLYLEAILFALRCVVHGSSENVEAASCNCASLVEGAPADVRSRVTEVREAVHEYLMSRQDMGILMAALGLDKDQEETARVTAFLCPPHAVARHRDASKPCTCRVEGADISGVNHNDTSLPVPHRVAAYVIQNDL